MIWTEALVEVSESLAFYLKKARAPRAYREHLRLAALAERPLKVAIDRWFRMLAAAVREELPAERPAGTASEIAEKIVDWKAFERVSRPVLEPALLEGLVAVGRRVYERHHRRREKRTFDLLKQTFDPISQRATAYARGRGSTLITLITEESKDAIREIVGGGLRAGDSWQTMARQVRTHIGLNRPQIGSYNRTIDDWISQGLDPDEISVRAEGLFNRLLRERAELIVRTEGNRAARAGIAEGYGQMGLEFVEWITDPEACDICVAIAAADGGHGPGVYTIEESEAVGDTHPNCECTWVAAEPVAAPAAGGTEGGAGE